MDSFSLKRCQRTGVRSEKLIKKKKTDDGAEELCKFTGGCSSIARSNSSASITFIKNLIKK